MASRNLFFFLSSMFHCFCLIDQQTKYKLIIKTFQIEVGLLLHCSTSTTTSTCTTTSIKSINYKSTYTKSTLQHAQKKTKRERAQAEVK